jgi:hypothetical protein
MAYFYFDYKDRERQSVMHILSSLLKQLAARINYLIPELLDCYTFFTTRRKRPELPHILRNLIAVSQLFPSTFIIFDALNELDDSQRAALLIATKELYVKGKAIKLLATSRPHLRDVQEFFNGYPSLPIRADILDIRNYLNRKVNERLSESNYDLKNKIVDTLSSSAQEL